MKYQLFRITTKKVCVPSTDYYARDNDWQTEKIKTLELMQQYETEEEAEEDLRYYPKEQYVILPIYENK